MGLVGRVVVHHDALRFLQADQIRVFGVDRPDGDAHHGPLHVPALDQLLHHRAGEVDGNGEAVPGVEPGLARDRRVDADHLSTHVHERPARVAGVDGRVGLDEVLNGVARLLQAAQQPSLGAHDPGRDREGEVLTERIADREHPLPDADGVGVPELRRGQAVGVDLDDGDVGAGVGPHDPRRELPLVEELHRDAIGARHHVVVGQDVAVRRDDEARARALLDLRPAPQLRKEVVEPRRQPRVARLLPLLGPDEHHGRLDVLGHGHERVAQIGDGLGRGERAPRRGGGLLGGEQRFRRAALFGQLE